MIRNLKVLGLALVAASVMSAVGASAAQAIPTISWESGATKLTATQEPETSGGSQLFKITNSSLSVTCNEVHGTVNLPGGVTSASELTTSEITYTDSTKEADHCRGPLGTSPKINMNGCQYNFHITATLKEAPNGEGTGTVDIVCPAGKEITTEGAACTLHFPAQNGLSHVIYRTVKTTTGAEKEHVTIEPTVSNIKYKHTGLCGNGEGNDGVFTGNLTVTAEDNLGTPKDVTVT